MRLAEIHIYPVKSLRGDAHASAEVEPRGLAGDRRWLVVDEADRFLTQRELPHMATVAARNEPDGLALSAPDRPPIFIPIPPPDAAPRQVTIWRDTVEAVPAGPEAESWLASVLGVPCALVFQANPASRPVNPAFAVPGDVVSFADGYPLLITSVSSLDALGDWLVETGDEPVPMNRFRPNAVIAGTPAWAEDDWHRVRIGAVTFRVAKPCGRCQVTTTDQFTGERGRQPLRMLGLRRKFGQSLVFGQNVIPEAPGTIEVGDPVGIIE